MTGALWVLTGLLMTLFIAWLAGLPEGDTTGDFWRGLFRWFAWPCALREWWRTVRKHGPRVLIAHPHHYLVAAGLSSAMLYLGHFGAEHHTTAWLYAVLENLANVNE